jgi:hypothetical protein
LEFCVVIDAARGIVVVTVDGACTRDGSARMVSAARAAARANRGMPILYDLRHASPGELSKSDIFWMARTTPLLKDGEAARVRVATVFPGEHGETARFWEDSFRNAGLEARAFEDEADAVAWLRES